MLAYDELLAVVGLAKRIERMILAAEAPLAEMCPQGLRDPDGRLGLYIVCAQPLVEPVRRPGMNDAKAWVLLAVLASAKYSGDCPVKVDYIGLADPRGMNGELWYYEVDMNAARRIHRDIYSGGLAVELGYDRIIGAWHRVTPAQCEEYERKSAALVPPNAY